MCRGDPKDSCEMPKPRKTWELTATLNVSLNHTNSIGQGRRFIGSKYLNEIWTLTIGWPLNYKNGGITPSKPG